MYPKSLLSGIIFSLVIALSACATDTTTKSATALDDATLNDNVAYAVRGVPGVESGDLSVSTSYGVVTLTGRTDTRAQAQDAIEAARQVPGVQKVDYDINVDEH